MNIPSMSRMIICFESNVNSVTSSGESGGGLVGDICNQVRDGIVGGIKDGIAWIGKGILEMFQSLIPVAEWGCKFVIVSCIIIYICSEDNKYVSRGIRTAIIFTLLCFLESVSL